MSIVVLYMRDKIITECLNTKQASFSISGSS